MGKANIVAHLVQHLFHHPGRTRSEIANALEVRKNTVGEICRKLVSAGVLHEEQSNRKRNSRLSLTPSAFLALGVEHRVDSLRIVVMDASRGVVSQHESALGEIFQEERVKTIIGEMRRVVAALHAQQDRIAGIGFSDFIPHNIGTGLKTKSVWMPGWGDINIKALLENGLGLSVTIMRCTDAHAVAEHAFGACQEPAPFCVLQLDQGIGLSVFKDGVFLKGSTDIFGEMGHTVYREDGEICKCGNRGCLETVAGTEAIVRKVSENIAKGVPVKIREGRSSVTLDDIILSAQEGNKLARLVLTEATKAIGDTAAVIVNMLGIVRIILYGDLAKAEEILLQQVTNAIRKHCIYPLNLDTRVSISRLDRFASAIGAAYKVLSEFDLEHLYFDK